ncbi:MAG: cytochrome b N-terminal domain-containing protein [Nitrospirota bacterium]
MFNWAISRFNLKAAHRTFLQRRLPLNITYLHCLGGIAFTLYLVLLLTGMLLSVYYVPSEAEAFQSVLNITREVPLGFLIRGLHKWSAHLFIVFLLLHMIRVVLHRAYRPPRELNWMAGTALLIPSFASGFTGYLLPWDQKAYWATVVGTNMATTIPVVGKYLLYFLRGEADVNGMTLVRFYSLHIIWLPLLTGLLLWAHFHMVKRQGISGGL